MNEKVCIKDVGIQQASDLSFVILIRFFNHFFSCYFSELLLFCMCDVYVLYISAKNCYCFSSIS